MGIRYTFRMIHNAVVVIKNSDGNFAHATTEPKIFSRHYSEIGNYCGFSPDKPLKDVNFQCRLKIRRHYFGVMRHYSETKDFSGFLRDGKGFQCRLKKRRHYGKHMLDCGSLFNLVTHGGSKKCMKTEGLHFYKSFYPPMRHYFESSIPILLSLALVTPNFSRHYPCDMRHLSHSMKVCQMGGNTDGRVS